MYFVRTNIPDSHVKLCERYKRQQSRNTPSVARPKRVSSSNFICPVSHEHKYLLADFQKGSPTTPRCYHSALSREILVYTIGSTIQNKQWIKQLLARLYIHITVFIIGGAHTYIYINIITFKYLGTYIIKHSGIYSEINRSSSKLFKNNGN